MADGNDCEDMPPGIPPEVTEQIRRAREFQRAAAELHAMLCAAGLEIMDLSVAFFGGVVALSGKTFTVAARDGAAELVRRQENVREVSNAIVVIPRPGSGE